MSEGGGEGATVDVNVKDKCLIRKHKRCLGRFTTDVAYADLLRGIRQVSPWGHVSAGKSSEFAWAKPSGAVLLLDRPMPETFTTMATAHHLVAAHSTLSYVAGLLSRGKVYMIEPNSYWTPSLPEWSDAATLNLRIGAT
jgi:hypothetical protein